jgi:hypothetical protein
VQPYLDSVSEDIIVHNKSNEPKLKYFLQEWSVSYKSAQHDKKLELIQKRWNDFPFFFRPIDSQKNFKAQLEFQNSLMF